MTVCVAAICGDGKALVLVSDRMIGVGYAEAEPEIKKNVRLHKRWWAMFAGNDISPIFDILDGAKKELQQSQAELDDVMKAVADSWSRKRSKDAEAMYLTPRNWTTESFRDDAGNKIPESVYREIDGQLGSFEIPGDIQILVAGFDSAGQACIFTVTSAESGIAKRCDIPGFYAIGSGGTGALYMMYSRGLSPKTPPREAFYYALEAKYFGEHATGVGTSTDMYIVKPSGKFTVLDDENTIEKTLIPICQRLEPRELDKKAIETLNSLRELRGFDKIKHNFVRRKKVKPVPFLTYMLPKKRKSPKKAKGK